MIELNTESHLKYNFSDDVRDFVSDYVKYNYIYHVCDAAWVNVMKNVWNNVRKNVTFNVEYDLQNHTKLK